MATMEVVTMTMDMTSTIQPAEQVSEQSVDQGGSRDAGRLISEPGPVSESSAHGAEMLIRLKEGVGYVYPVPQGYIAEMAREEEVEKVDGPMVEDPDLEESENMRGSFSQNSVAIQVNDYEIERRSGVLPARRRLIPFKFRDFQNPEDILGDDMSDEDYDPDETQYTKRPNKTTPRPGIRGVGRPRKVRKDHAYDRGEETKEGQMAAGEEGEEVASGEEAPEEKNKKKVDPPFPRRGRPPKGDYNHPKIFKCLQCDKRFSLKGNLKVHMRTHTDERPFKCELAECGKAFRSNESLRRHNMSHQGIKLFGCDICDKRFSSNVALKEHMARHTDTKDQVCPVCSRAFRQLSCLRRHMTTHTSDTPHACAICPKRFSQAVYLRSHMRSHTGERPYQCDTCGKTFSHQSDKMRHMTIHLGTKPYVCEVCQARFSDPSTRRRHVREHNGFKPYTCQLCGDNFKRSGQLKAHLNKKHMNYKEDVVITKQGQFNSFQFQFKGNKNTGVAEQLAAAGKTQYVPQVVGAPASTEGHVITLAAGQDHVQLIDENGHIQHLQVQHVQQQQAQQDQNTTQNQAVLGHIQQQLVQAGFSQSQLDGNQIILAQTNSVNQEDLLEETQKIIQQIQSRLDPFREGKSGITGSQQVKVAYQILHDDDNQQIVEIQYHPVEVDEVDEVVDGQAVLMGGVQEAGGGQQEAVEQQEMEQQHVEQQHKEGIKVEEEQETVRLIMAAQHIEKQQSIEQETHRQMEKQPPIEQQPVEQQIEQQQIEQQYQIEQHQQIANQRKLDQQKQHIQQPQQEEDECHVMQEIDKSAQLVTEQQSPLTETYNAVTEIRHATNTEEDSKEQCHIMTETAQEVVEGVTVIGDHHLIASTNSDPKLALVSSSESNVLTSVVQEVILEEPPVEALHEQQMETGEHDDDDGHGGGYTENDGHVIESVIEEQKGVDAGEATVTLLNLQNLEQQQQQASVDYVTNPDFNCQEYYNWLSSFTELCKLVPMPLDVDLFQKISQVHKSLSDVLATPRGILTNRENFRTLMNISKELNGIINEHLTFVLQNLDTDIDLE